MKFSIAVVRKIAEIMTEAVQEKLEEGAQVAEIEQALREVATNCLVEKYMSDDMSDQERSDFEEHMFACPVCSEEVRQDFTLIETLKSLTPDQVPEAMRNGIRLAGWRDWFRPASLIPTFAAVALACVVGYQNLGSGAGEIASVAPVALINPVTKGGGDVVSIPVSLKSRVFVLHLNSETLPSGSFAGEVDDFAGRKILVLPNGVQNKSTELQVTLPTKNFPVGKYELVLRPAAEPDSIVTYPFAVEEFQVSK